MAELATDEKIFHVAGSRTYRSVSSFKNGISSMSALRIIGTRSRHLRIFVSVLQRDNFDRSSMPRPQRVFRGVAFFLYFYNIGTMDISTAVINLSALAQESRLQIFRLLVQNGPDGLCVSDIGEELGIAPATLSFHLKELHRAGLVTASRESRHIYYAPNFLVMNDLLGFLTENCCGGVSCGPICKPAPKQKRGSK